VNPFARFLALFGALFDWTRGRTVPAPPVRQQFGDAPLPNPPGGGRSTKTPRSLVKLRRERKVRMRMQRESRRANRVSR
jgi:hypothetical protein